MGAPTWSGICRRNEEGSILARDKAAYDGFPDRQPLQVTETERNMRGITNTTDRFRALWLIAAVALAAGVLLVLGEIKPAEAAFPGTNGLIVFTSNRITTANPTGDAEIYTIDPTNPSSSLTQLTDNTAADFDPAWSPNGTQIAFRSERDGDSDIYKMDTDPTTNDATRLTKDGASDYPDWSPNGKKIAFETVRDGDYEIFKMNPNGTNQTRLTRNLDADHLPNWSPNGKKIAFRSFRDGDSEVYTMRADGSKKRNLTKNAALDSAPAFSPDGQKIAFHSDRDGSVEVFTMDADGSNQTNISSGPSRNPDWQPL